MNRKQIEQYAKSKGLKIAIGHPLDWFQSGQNFRQYYAAHNQPKRAYSYSVYSEGYKAWIEPKKHFGSLTELLNSVKELISSGTRDN
jgi:hypothetical protein